jgi:hypothetical protein
MLTINPMKGILLSLVFLIGTSILVFGNANATPPDCFLNVDATSGTCWTSPTDFLDGTGVGSCTVTPNGNINCTCSGELWSVVIPDDCPPDAETPGPFAGCGAIIGNNTDLCCITGTGVGPYGTVVTTNNHSNATPSGRLNFQCHTGGGRPAPEPE